MSTMRRGAATLGQERSEYPVFSQEPESVLVDPMAKAGDGFFRTITRRGAALKKNLSPHRDLPKAIRNNTSPVDNRPRSTSRKGRHKEFAPIKPAIGRAKRSAAVERMAAGQIHRGTITAKKRSGQPSTAERLGPISAGSRAGVGKRRVGRSAMDDLNASDVAEEQSSVPSTGSTIGTVMGRRRRFEPTTNTVRRARRPVRRSTVPRRKIIAADGAPGPSAGRRRARKTTMNAKDKSSVEYNPEQGAVVRVQRGAAPRRTRYDTHGRSASRGTNRPRRERAAATPLQATNVRPRTRFARDNKALAAGKEAPDSRLSPIASLNKPQLLRVKRSRRPTSRVIAPKQAATTRNVRMSVRRAAERMDRPSNLTTPAV
ncbi:hypothetical protein AAVH_33537 [Aphelenchoides avenae]|nr:hypothetical protein AAVH_33537 [Aphelenchus avenae]